MKKIALFFLFILALNISFCQQNLFAQKEAKAEKISELTKLTRLEELKTKTIEASEPRIWKAYSSAAPESPEYTKEIKEKLMAFDYIGAVAKFYDEHYSLEEIETMIAFYSTPAGQKTLDKGPLLAKHLQDEMLKVFMPR